MTQILLFIAAYFVALGGLAVAAIPSRRRLRVLGAELLCLELNPRERLYVEGIMSHAYSWRSALLMLLDYIAGMFESTDTMERKVRELRSEYPVLLSDGRMFEMGEAYFASVLAVNPLVGIATVTARRIFRIKLRLHRSATQAREIVDMRGMSAV